MPKELQFLLLFSWRQKEEGKQPMQIELLTKEALTILQLATLFPYYSLCLNSGYPHPPPGHSVIFSTATAPYCDQVTQGGREGPLHLPCACFPLILWHNLEALGWWPGPPLEMFLPDVSSLCPNPSLFCLRSLNRCHKATTL